MEELETIDLDLEEASELLFKVRVEGAENGPLQVRLVCEGQDMALMFSGKSAPGDDMVQFKLPSLKGTLKEGTYLSRVEVLVDNRYFSPVQFNARFKKTLTVVAESVKVSQRKAPPEVKVSASPIALKSGGTLRERYAAKQTSSRG